MKLVVTGCNGSIGRRVVLLSLKRGYVVTGIDLKPLPEEVVDAIQRNHYTERFMFHQIDLKEYDRVLEVLQSSGCEAVIHLAIYPHPTENPVEVHNTYCFGSLC